MKHVAAYLLCTLGGHAHPAEKDIKKVFASVDATVDDERLAALIKEVHGKDINEIIAAGLTKLASVPAAGAAPAAAAPAAAGAAAPAAEKGGKKKEEAKEEEADEDMGFSLFD